MLWSVTLEVNH